MLARRFARRGLVLSAALAVVAETVAPAPAALVISTVKAAAHVASGETMATAGLSATVAALTEGVLETMWRKQLRFAAIVVLTVALVGASAGLLVRQALADNPAKDNKAPAGEKGGKDKKEMGPTVRGYATAVDAAKKSITVSVTSNEGGKKTEEKTYALAGDVKVILADNLTKDQAPPEGKLADVTPGTGVELQLSVDKKTVERITAHGPAIHGGIKSVDAAKHTITVLTKGEKGQIEKTLTVPKEVKATLSDGLSKEDKPQEKKATELEEGTRVVVQLSVDRKSAVGIRVEHDALRGTLKGIDTGNNTLTVEVKEDGGLVEKLLTLVKGAQLEGNPKSGDTVVVELSVFDKKKAVRVRVP
jgi:hypothetical protein